MKATLIILSVLFLAASAGAYELCFNIPPGSGLTRLGGLCDWQREDANKPDMGNPECGYRLFLRGAFEANHERKVRELRAGGREALATEDEKFRDDLPMPPDATPVPTPSPTVSPTVSPTASPTVSPTVTPAP